MKIIKKHLLPLVKALSFDMTLKEGRIARDFRKQMLEFYSEMDKDRVALAEKYCKKTEDGKSEFTEEGNFKFEQEGLDVFVKEVNELIEETVEIQGDEKVLLELLEKTEAKVSPDDIVLIDKAIEDIKAGMV